ncbi:MAG: PhoU domain-containing protein [Sulfolobales archaeon]
MTGLKPIDLAIERIRDKISEMSGLIEQIINEMSKGFYRVEDISDQVNKVRLLRTEIHSLVTEAIARYQPAASDLRYLLASLEISYGLFRFSRYALDIAYMIKRFREDTKMTCEFTMSREILPHVLEMMKESIASFIEKDSKKANRVISLDSHVDKMFSETVGRAFSTGERCALLDLVISIYLERIADHSVYIASETLFMI